MNALTDQVIRGDKISEYGCFAIVVDTFVDLLYPRHGAPKLSILEVLAKMAKDSSLPLNLATILVKGFAEVFAPKAS